MMNRRTWETGLKFIKIILAAVAVYIGVRYIFPILLPFFIALLLAKLLYPLAEKIERKTGLKRTMACALTYFIFLLLVAGIAAVLCYLCYRMGSSCMQNMGRIADKADEVWCICCEKVEQLLGISTDALEKGLKARKGIMTDGAVRYSKEAGQWALGFFARILVTFVSTLLILNDYSNLRDKVCSSSLGRKVRKMFTDMKKAVWAYLKAQMMILGIVSLICILGLVLMKNKYAVPAGIAIGIFDALPFLGTGTIFIPWALIDVLMGNYVIAIAHIAIYIVCAFTRQILEPKLVGTKLGVHPLAVLMSIYIGIKIYGGAGVIFGPVSALIIWEIWKLIEAGEKEGKEDKV